MLVILWWLGSIFSVVLVVCRVVSVVFLFMLVMLMSMVSGNLFSGCLVDLGGELVVCRLGRGEVDIGVRLVFV